MQNRIPIECRSIDNRKKSSVSCLEFPPYEIVNELFRSDVGLIFSHQKYSIEIGTSEDIGVSYSHGVNYSFAVMRCKTFNVDNWKNRAL